MFTTPVPVYHLYCGNTVFNSADTPSYDVNKIPPAGNVLPNLMTDPFHNPLTP